MGGKQEVRNRAGRTNEEICNTWYMLDSRQRSSAFLGRCQSLLKGGLKSWFICGAAASKILQARHYGQPCSYLPAVEPTPECLLRCADDASHPSVCQILLGK